MAPSPPKNSILHQVERRVLPTQPSTTPRTTSSVRDTAHLDDETCEPSQPRKWRRLSKARQERAQWHQSRAFFIVLLVVLVVCLSWTCWLMLLTVAPNEAINYVMRTRELDNGSFWMLVEPTPSLRALSLAGLAIVVLGYIYIGVMLLAWRRQRISTGVPSVSKLSVDFQVVSSPDLRQLCSASKRSVNQLASIHPEQPETQASRLPSLSKGSDARKIVCLWMKVVDLMLQLFMLYQTLEAGFPLPLVVACTLIVVWNAFAVVALMHSPSPPSQMSEAVVDSISDFLVAVGFPVLVLSYCLTTFEFDRASQRLSADLFPHSSFQNAARVHANPEQIAKVFKSLEGLRFQSVGACIARIGNNVALLISLRRLIRFLRAQGPPSAELKVKSSIYPRKHPLALLLVAIALGTVIFVSGSVHRSRNACREFPMCTMHAYRWWLSNTKTNESESWNCPCRVLIDVDVSPTNYSTWKDPPDATAVVSKLAAAGDLEILQIINRRLPDLPDTLRRCSRLKHIALVFTHTTTLPHWASEFTDLEFLHVEGKARETSLSSLPQGLFSNMKKLTFVHLGEHVNLPRLPDVAGLTNLRSITMANLAALDTLPADFAQLTRLEILLVVMMPRLETFPDLTRARRTLKTLVIDMCRLCCDGFLQSDCDLSSSTCSQPNEALACLPPGLTATTGMLELFQTFNSTICVERSGPTGNQTGLGGSPPDHGTPHVPGMPSDAELEAALERSMQQCAGVLYRECQVEPAPDRPNSPSLSSGICSSDRYLPISCNGDPNTIELRRQQIERHIGPVCNPQYEAWLGCHSS
ncbi:hypothetical protein PHYPSEUDO_010046 [Phytophthora pseudosyringae]|uniref:WLGC domain-containing protein n=1 Tax=Phytophthora pseudosyringae TaxID=221518 RepID=A0A8T1WDC6_9STRA|nr:hypothetical protein PHYPSEUDO_010046 [Phytophthora pseudosyringae]